MLSINTFIVSCLILNILLPAYLTYLHEFSIAVTLLFYLIDALLIIYLIKKHSREKNHLELAIQAMKEGINLMNDNNSSQRKHSIALQLRIGRYNSLKEIIEKINRNPDLDYIGSTLIDIAFSLISNDKGTCLLYLIERGTQKLRLFKTRKDNAQLVIKAKGGDLFDFWVLKHSSPLLVEGIKKDFRFDLDKINSEEKRPISSIISAPFISAHRFLGVLRLDSPEVGFYTQEDLRFLAAICDLGAVAIENGEYFEKTKDLAIHDGLTGFFTKAYFLERLKEESIRCRRHNAVFSLCMLDIDYFKNYNDKFGHTAGDLVLKSLSRCIKDSLKSTNAIIGRFGGEEFCVILPELVKEKAYDVCERMRADIEKTKILLRRQETNVTVSMGIAFFPVDSQDEFELVYKADKAMYAAKEKGRNRICII